MPTGESVLGFLFKFRVETAEARRSIADFEKTSAQAGQKIVGDAKKSSEAFNELTSRLGAVKDQLASIVGGNFNAIGGLGQSIGGVIQSFNQLRAGASGATAATAGTEGALAGVGAAAGIAAGVVAGAAAVTVGLTVAMARASAELVTSSQLLGTNVEQLQRFRAAAEIAGSGADALTDAVRQLRSQADDVLRGNLALTESFARLGINAREATRDPATAFDALLDRLQQIERPLDRVTVAQSLLGTLSDDTAAAIIRLADNGGELRRELIGLSVAIDSQTAQELARLNTEFNKLSESLSTGAKRAVVGFVHELEFIGEALAFDVDQTADASRETQRLASAQQQAGQTFAGTTGQVNAQANALAGLVRQLTAAQIIERASKVFSDTTQKIAVQAGNAAEAIKLYKKELALNDDFFKAAGDSKRFADNLKALGELNNPGGAGRAKGGASSSASKPTDEAARARLKALESVLDQESQLYRENADRGRC